MKQILTALTVAALLVPLPANAVEMTKEKSEEIMAYGEIMGSKMAPTNFDDGKFVIRYQRSIFHCATSVGNINLNRVKMRRHLRIVCFSTEE